MGGGGSGSEKVCEDRSKDWSEKERGPEPRNANGLRKMEKAKKPFSPLSLQE